MATRLDIECYKEGAKDALLKALVDKTVHKQQYVGGIAHGCEEEIQSKS